MTIIWATIEAIVDDLIQWYHPINGTSIQDSVPISLDSKVSYLNKMARDPEFGENGSASLRYLKSQLKKLGKGRHVFLHGVVIDPRGDGKSWVLRLRNIRTDPHVVEQYSFAPPDLDELVRQMAELRNELGPWALKVMGRSA